MSIGTSTPVRPRRNRWATMVAVAGAAAVTGAVTVAGTASAAAPAPADPCSRAVTFTTEIQWGGSSAAWHPDTDLTLLINNRNDVVARGSVPVGTQLTWSGPNGNASIVFFGTDNFVGAAQFPGEGPVAYRGTASKAAAGRACQTAAKYSTQIQWGGFDAAWHPDTDLTLLISNRRDVVARGTKQTGTQISWSGSNGSANVVLNGSDFSGGAQFPNEGPVGYRGTMSGS